MAKGRFQLSRITKNTANARGQVRVSVILVERGNSGQKPVKGNICRSFTVADAKVDEIAAAIESLFDK